MTCPEAQHANLVSVARLPVGTLLELLRTTATFRSSDVHNMHEEDHNVAAPSKTSKKPIRRTTRRSRRTTPPGSATAVTPSAGAVATLDGQDNSHGGQR